MQLKHLNSKHKTRLIDYITAIPSHNLPKMRNIGSLYKSDIDVDDMDGDEIYKTYRNAVDNFDSLKDAYRDALEHVEVCEDMISKLHGILEYITTLDVEVHNVDIEQVFISDYEKTKVFGKEDLL